MFQKESDLVESFIDCRNSFLRVLCGKTPNRSFVVKEFDSQFGIADIVVGTFLKHKRLSSIETRAKANWFLPLSSMKQGEIFSLNDYSSKFGYSLGYSREMLKLYCEEGYVENQDGLFKVIKSYEVILEDVIAIEAKLKNWKRALLQARRYKKFANQSFVLLDQKHIAAALKNLNSFQESNVGLISLHNRKIIFHLLPEKIDRKFSPQLIELNESAKASMSITQ